jgi:signal transduction histidine kinase
MTHHAVTMGGDDDLTLRLDVLRPDELGDLAREFDRMVAKLADSRRQLVDRSFAAGISENASGVLHNLGNAMTPLCVKVAALENTLRTAPAGDIELVLGELASSTLGAARESDLQAFLRVTSKDLARVITVAQDEAAAVYQHTQTMQAVLAEQAPHSRSAKIFEPVALTDLIGQSAELVSPDLRGRLAIEIDGSVATVGSVRVARITLQQVIQNLIVNAAEAVQEAGRDHGSLRIVAAVTENASGPRLHMMFADSGVGIREQHLQHIFEKGFTTKSSATNSGIGLHWCSNAVNALGGHLRAESAGPHGGTTLHLDLPIELVADTRITIAA